MIGLSTSSYPRAGLRSVAGGLLIAIAVAACAGDGVGPSAEVALPADSTDITSGDTTIISPADSTSLTPADSTLPPADSTLIGDTVVPTLEVTSTRPGIVFGSFNMKYGVYNTINNGAVRALEPTWLLGELAGVRAKGGRVAIKLVGGLDNVVQNSDRTFSLTKWKALVNRFKTINFSSYVADGTVLGIYLIDEPQNAAKWGGKSIPHSTVEEMARHSKQIWSSMTTFVRATPSWLAGSTITYTYLDAGWIQYEPYNGDVNRWVTAEVAAAKRKGLGLVVGLNVLNGGNGSSGIPGTRSGKYAMSATELRKFGSAVIGQSYACAFFMWMYKDAYYARSDITSAMADLSATARIHPKTSCRQ